MRLFHSHQLPRTRATATCCLTISIHTTPLLYMVNGVQTMHIHSRSSRADVPSSSSLNSSENNVRRSYLSTFIKIIIQIMCELIYTKTFNGGCALCLCSMLVWLAPNVYRCAKMLTHACFFSLRFITSLDARMNECVARRCV